jgi:hypothetical protein
VVVEARAVRVHDPVHVDGQHVARLGRLQQPDDRRSGGADPAHHDPAL